MIAAVRVEEMSSNLDGVDCAVEVYLLYGAEGGAAPFTVMGYGFSLTREDGVPVEAAAPGGQA